MSNDQTIADIAINYIIDHEGGYVNDPHDTGGETKYGISKASYPDVDIANLTQQDAFDIYKRDYWEKMQLNDLCMISSATVYIRSVYAKGAGVAMLLADHGVNAGPSSAIKLVQELSGTTVDGVVGPNTTRAVHNWIDHGSSDEESFQCPINQLTRQRVMYYSALSQFDRYGKGWLNRVISMHNSAINVMIGEL